jgi:hypothetical protein
VFECAGMLLLESKENLNYDLENESLEWPHDVFSIYPDYSGA